jgi:hypothetical protein
VASENAGHQFWLDFNDLDAYGQQFTAQPAEWNTLSQWTRVKYTVNTTAGNGRWLDISSGAPGRLYIRNLRVVAGQSTMPETSDASDWSAAPDAAAFGVPYTLVPSSTLYGINGFLDGLNNQGGEAHSTKMLTLNGSENWATNAGWATNSYFVSGLLTDSASVSGYTSVADMISSHFTVLSPSSIADGTGNTGIGIGGGTDLFVGFGMDTSRVPMKNVAAFKAWLAANPVTIVYRRAAVIGGSPAPVQIVGGDGENTIVYDGSSIYVAYTGSGWALVSGTARRFYSGANYKWDENGQEIMMTSIDGKPVATKYQASAEKHGIFRVSDGKQLQGARVLPDGTVAGVSGVIIDPDGDENASYRMHTDESGVWLDLVHATHAGPGPSVNPDLDNTPITAWQKLLSIGANVVPGWVPGEYSDEVYVVIKTLLGAAFALYGGSITLSALDGSGSSTCGMSLDADGDGRTKTWGNGIVPSSNGGQSVGSPSLGYNYYYGVHTSIQSTSDERVKHDMRPLDSEAMTRFIMEIDPIWFRLNDFPEDLMAGFGARAFLEAMRRAGIPNDYAGYNGKDLDHLCLDYGQLIAPIVSVMQRQEKRIEELERKLNALTNDLK